jgi:oligoendopeptidase F
MPNNNSYKQSRWSLTDLYPSSDGPEIKQAFTKLDALINQLEAYRPDLDPQITSQKFLEIIRLEEEISKLESRLAGFASLWFAEDTQNQTALSLMAQIDQMMAEYGNRELFFSLWWKSLDDQDANRLMQDAGDYRYFLEEIRHFKPHTLTEPEEKVINIKNVTGFNAFTTLYDAITNRYTFKITVDGQEQELTRDGLMVYARHHNPDVRKAAYQEMYRVYSQDGNILGQMYQTIARDWQNENVQLRHFKSPITARNLGNDIPDDVVDTLLEVAQSNSGIFQRYFELKAKWLGMDRLRRYDIYAPVTQSEKHYSFEEAAKTVFESFHEFDPHMEELARMIPAEGHLDSEVRKGKRSGAFCATLSPDLTPWVLVNYQGRPNDIATMAHELGHAIHSLLANQHSYFTQHASLPLAETASTFGEMMLVDKLLKQETDASVRRDLLFRQMDDAYATIQRQAYFALFEKQAHDMINNNASVDQLAEAYLGNLKQQFGEAVELNEEFKWEWVSIPHFYHTPFYVYAYSFGQLLVMALYKQFKSEGESFKPRYIKLLSTGGSKSPENILLDAGIDFHQRAFWQGGFDIISGLVDQLEKLPVERK